MKDAAFRVHMVSAPGPWATYDGHVDIVVPLATGALEGTASDMHACNACRLDWMGRTEDGTCPYCHSAEVDLLLDESDQAHALFRRAVKARTSFPDRPSLDSWRLVAIEDKP